MSASQPHGSLTSILAVLMGAVLFAPSEAGAYLDPGTGSIVLQAVVGTVLGGLYIVRSNWARLVSYVKREDPTSGAGEEVDAPADDPVDRDA